MATRPVNPFVAFAKAEIEQSIPSRFEQQVSRHPNRLAVGTTLHRLTYRQLDQLANRVAHGILACRGIGSEPVVLVLEQGAPLVAAILGVLKAGKMYVPMDPSDPAARIAFTVADSGAALVLADRPDITEVPMAAGMPVTPAATPGLVLTLDELVSGEPDQPPSLALTAETPAYIYYTSGSTGRPKGVHDIHRNVLHNVMRYTNSLHIAAEDRLTLLQAPSFSGAVSSLFSALLNGAAVFPYDLQKQGMGRGLAAWLDRERITICHSVPMIFRSFLTGDARFPAVRLIRLEGDAATKVDVELYRRHFEQGCLLVNGLGATETGISRQFFMDMETDLHGGIVPIGYATEDMHAMVVDQDGHEVAVGAVGEIAIRSKYLATGYWGQPELTRTAFLPGPDGSDERIYRTGDLGRMCTDGCLEYLGRKDLGLKIRGHRVEPAEVERALLALDAVREAAAVTREDTPGDPRLVAYLVPADTPHLPVPVLRRLLAKTLPDYMIPTRFVMLDRLPLGPNGKVDRRALPPPDRAQVLRTSEIVPPRDRLEEQLARIWEELLHTCPVGVTENFFDLGGDSFLAAALLVALEKLTAEELPPETVHDAPTIEQLARVIRGEHQRSHSVLVPIQRYGTAPPLFFAPPHNGHAMGFAALSRRLGGDQPFYGVQPAIWSHDQRSLIPIEAMAARCLEAVRSVQPHGPYFLGGQCFGSVLAFEMAQQLMAGGEPVGLLFLTGVAPDDFPSLVSDAAERRFRHHRLLGLVGLQSTVLLGRPMWKRPLYVVREVGRAMGRAVSHLERKAALRSSIVLGHSLPERLGNDGFLNHQAGRLYVPRTYPGRVTLILRADEASMYSSNPALDWKHVAAGGYEIHFLPTGKSGVFSEPGVKALAEILAATIARANGVRSCIVQRGG